jgi:hypothetical protein
MHRRVLCFQALCHLTDVDLALDSLRIILIKVLALRLPLIPKGE